MDVLLVVLIMAFTIPLLVPLFTRNSESLISLRRYRKEEYILKIKIAGSKC